MLAQNRYQGVLQSVKAQGRGSCIRFQIATFSGELGKVSPVKVAYALRWETVLKFKGERGRERERGCLATKLRRLVSLRMREQTGAVLFCACVGGSLRTSPPLPPAGGGGMAVARATGIQYGGRILTLSSQGPPRWSTSRKPPQESRRPVPQSCLFSARGRPATVAVIRVQDEEWVGPGKGRGSPGPVWRRRAVTAPEPLRLRHLGQGGYSGAWALECDFIHSFVRSSVCLVAPEILRPSAVGSERSHCGFLPFADSGWKSIHDQSCVLLFELS